MNEWMNEWDVQYTHAYVYMYVYMHACIRTHLYSSSLEVSIEVFVLIAWIHASNFVQVVSSKLSGSLGLFLKGTITNFFLGAFALLLDPAALKVFICIGWGLYCQLIYLPTYLPTYLTLPVSSLCFLLRAMLCSCLLLDFSTLSLDFVCSGDKQLTPKTSPDEL